MQTSLGRKGDYSVRAVLFLSIHGGERQKAQVIADEMDIPSRYLRQILADLVQEGLLTAVAGPAGGYCLAMEEYRDTSITAVHGKAHRSPPDRGPSGLCGL